MKNFRIIFAFLLLFLCAPRARAAGDRVSTHFTPDDSDAPSFELATETAYMLGIINNPNSYEIGAQFITARWRFGPVYREGFFRGYNQFYFSGVAEPIFRGPENFYYGISIGLRYNFLPRKPIHSLRLRWRRARVDRQPRQCQWRAGTGFHIQLPRRPRCFLQDQRSVEGDRGPCLPASFQRRPNRSKPEPQSARAADRPDLLVLGGAPRE